MSGEVVRDIMERDQIAGRYQPGFAMYDVGPPPERPRFWQFWRMLAFRRDRQEWQERRMRAWYMGGIVMSGGGETPPGWGEDPTAGPVTWVKLEPRNVWWEEKDGQITRGGEIK